MTEEAKKETSKNLAKIITPVLVVLLVGTAFMSGSLYTKLKSTEKEKEEVTIEKEEPSPAEKTEQAPSVKGTLDADDLAEIENSKIVKGNSEAVVTIVEFSEYQCPYCKRYVDEAYSQIWQNYEGKIRYIFRDYPLPFHQHAQITAEAARCAQEQGDYWSYHDLLFEDRSWESAENINSTLVDFADQLNLDTNQFSDCLSSGKYTQAVKDDFELGKKVGVSGTPSFFVNGRMLVGAQPFEAFQTVIDEELNK